MFRHFCSNVVRAALPVSAVFISQYVGNGSTGLGALRSVMCDEQPPTPSSDSTRLTITKQLEEELREIGDEMSLNTEAALDSLASDINGKIEGESASSRKRRIGHRNLIKRFLRDGYPYIPPNEEGMSSSEKKRLRKLRRIVKEIETMSPEEKGRFLLHQEENGMENEPASSAEERSDKKTNLYGLTGIALVAAIAAGYFYLAPTVDPRNINAIDVWFMGKESELALLRATYFHPHRAHLQELIADKRNLKAFLSTKPFPWHLLSVREQLLLCQVFDRDPEVRKCLSVFDRLEIEARKRSRSVRKEA